MLSGKVRDGLFYHPNGTHVLYPLGMTLVVKRLKDNKQEFLDGHTNVISSVALSHDGNFAASGQKTHAGFKVKQACYLSACLGLVLFLLL